MANNDPDLAAQLLAAFSAPAAAAATDATGAFPDVSSLPSLSYDQWQWDDDHIADLLAEQKSEPRPEPAPVPTSQENLPSTPRGPSAAPQDDPHTPQTSSPQQGFKQEPQSVGPSRTNSLQQHQQQALIDEDQQKSLKEEDSRDQPSPSHKLPPPQGSLPSESSPPYVPQQQQQASQDAPSQSAPQQEHSQQQQLPQTAAPESPTLPVKRSRSPIVQGQDHEIPSEKRLKTDRHDLGQHDVDLSAANWDISAMIQNALGSFDEQVSHPLTAAGHGAGRAATPAALQATTSAPRKVEQKRMKFASNPFYVMRTMSLPLLGSLAIQILLSLSQQSREETMALLADEESEFRKAYDTLKTALGHARRIFSEGSPLLFADELDISDSEDRETIRMSNLAAVSTSAFAGDGAMLIEAHDNFPTVFVPEEGDFVKDLKPLYLGFKTQSLLSSLTTAHTPQERSDVLDRFFPPNFDELLTQRHGDAVFQNNREELVSEVGIKRQALLESILDDEKRQRLSEEYPVNEFLDNLVDYLQSHLTMVVDYAEKYGINIPVSEESVVDEPLGNEEHEGHDELSALLQSATSNLLDGMNGDGATDPSSDSLGLGKLIQESLQNHAAKNETTHVNGNSGGLLESGGLASLIASKLTDYDHFNNQSSVAGNDIAQHGLPGMTDASIQSSFMSQYNQLSQTPYYGYGQPPPPPPPADGSSLPPNQTHPTSVLYERARQAAVAKSSSAARREGIHSTRRAWTPEEEKALMAGLDMVKGPHWSQILSLFGANGSISSILKDRTQVQLKDKARNLKLFFLKTNSEMPYYLQCVTGELKTRAPGQAARKEAEEKARQNSEEEQARLQGIMTLAGGLQHHHAPVSSPMTPQQTPAYTRATPMTPHANSASLNRGVHTPVTPHSTQPLAASGTAQRGSNTQGFPTTNMASTMATAAPKTPSMSTGIVGTPNISTGAQVTPIQASAAGGGSVGYTSASAPPITSTAVTTPASPVVKTEPQDQPVSIQPKPALQHIRPAGPLGVTNGTQQPQRQLQPQAPRQMEQNRPAQGAPQTPQPGFQLSLPQDPPQPAQPVPPPAPVPGPVQQSATPVYHTPQHSHHSSPAPRNSHHSSPAPNPPLNNQSHDGDLAQLANYQPPAQHHHQQSQPYRQIQDAFHTNGQKQSNEHDDNHEPNADMTLLQTLQAALAAAPSG